MKILTGRYLRATIAFVTTPEQDQEPSPLTEAARQRLRDALIHRGMSQRDLSREIRVGESTVGAILSGKQKPQYATILAIFSALRVHPSYVIFGLGPQYIDETTSTSESHPGLKPIGSDGVDAWLLDAPEATTPAERAFLRGCRWPAPQVRLPDICYQLALTAFRQADAYSRGQVQANGR